VREQVKKSRSLYGAAIGIGASIKMRCKDWYSALRTASGQSAHRGHTNDSSVRAFAVKPRAFGAPLRGFGA
jgi:hypothetical protein